MSVTDAFGRYAVVLRRLGRPAGIVARARWLFLFLALLSLLISVPSPLSADSAALRAMALAASLTIMVSCVLIYLSGRVSLALDVVDAVAVAAFALACPTPQPVFGYLFASIWFRGLYGPIWRSLTRCGLYAVAIGVGLPLWQRILGETIPPVNGAVFATVPLMLITVMVAPQLGSGLSARERGLARDAVLADAGSQLLGLTDAMAIRSVAGTTGVQLCAFTPGLRLLTVVRSGEELRVEGGTGGFTTVPATLPDDVIEVLDDPSEGRVGSRKPLSDAVGVVLEWQCVRLADQGEDAWLLAGAPKAAMAEAMLAVRSLANQIKLALRNSDVHKELTAQARTDSLTGLANRASFTGALASALTWRQLGTDIHVLFLDLDDFKDVNDVLGHRAGDELLMEVADRLRSCTRPEDLCARLGGDEFAVLLRGATDVDATDIAQRMVDSIAEPVHLGGRTARVGVSVGISAASQGAGIEEVVHRADVAMYAAKAHGKGRVQLFDPGLLSIDTSTVGFDQDVAGAVAAGQFVVHYQPILTLPDLRCVAVEAFLRWQHPVRGLLLPAQFLESAERTGAIVDIGSFMLQRACADLAGWRAARPERLLTLHITLSARQLDQDQFVDTMLDSLATHRLSAADLVVQFTEDTVNASSAIRLLESLAAQGVQIAIDDVGAGYSSLRSLPVNVLKLKSTLVAGALINPVDRTVVETIVDMSNRLGLKTVAEGVERLEQQHLLERAGAGAVQGDLYLAPASVSDLATWLDGNINSTQNLPSNVVTLRRPQPA